ncbi:MAG: uroporphyrinogen decarboxylase family protein [Planctomycetota bacterium]
MTSKERLLKIFKGEIPDRPAVKLMGAAPGQKLLHPAYEPVYKLAMEKTDLMPRRESDFNLYFGADAEKFCHTVEKPTQSPAWVDQVTTVQTPEGPLTQVFTISTANEPGYEKEYLLKEPDDIKKLLSIAYRPLPFSADEYFTIRDALADRGVANLVLDHVMYGLQRIIGPENFALWSIEARDLYIEAMQTFAERIRNHAIEAFKAGAGPLFGWVGPECCLPPMMSPGDFEDFVFNFDKPLIDLIHENGGYVWVHCHGKVGNFLKRFIDMGVNVLQPVEPPPMGDITLAEAFQKVGNKIALEGNIENGALMEEDSRTIAELVTEALQAGHGRRFILCPTASYHNWPHPTKRYIENLITFITHALRLVESSER